jgi:proteasome assembly chaperone (PAC2) family protein
VSHVEYRGRPKLSEPVVVCAFAGWNDGGEGATTAVRELREQWSARLFAAIDPEEFYDFQVNRPTVRLVDGETRQVDWPTNEFSWARAGSRDVVVFLGIEPNVRWRTYCEQILRVCSDVEASMVVTLGAFLADVPHTIASPVSAASSDPSWSSHPAVAPARYEGPTGIVGVLTDVVAKAGIPALSLWAASPHYLPQSTNPRAAYALMERLRDLVGLPIDTGEIELAARTWEREVTDSIDEDGNLAQYVKRLEEAAEEGLVGDLSDVPTGEDLAAELERYLREHGSSEGD